MLWTLYRAYRACPNVTIVLEKMAPGHTWPWLEPRHHHERLLNEIDSLANSMSTATSQVIVIDMATGFADSLLADPIHYNQAGAQFIADRYMTLLDTILLE